MKSPVLPTDVIRKKIDEFKSFVDANLTSFEFGDQVTLKRLIRLEFVPELLTYFDFLNEPASHEWEGNRIRVRYYGKNWKHELSVTMLSSTHLRYSGPESVEWFESLGCTEYPEQLLNDLRYLAAYPSDKDTILRVVHSSEKRLLSLRASRPGSALRLLWENDNDRPGL